jgi:hypothetical protein
MPQSFAPVAGSAAAGVFLFVSTSPVPERVSLASAALLRGAPTADDPDHAFEREDRIASGALDLGIRLREQFD